MAKQEVKLGMTDYTVLVFIPDSASTDGSGKTGLVAANLTVSYTRVETDNDVTVADATGSLNDLSALTDAHADWGIKEVSSTVAPGLYRLDIADAVFASGAWSAVVYVMVTTSAAAASPMEFILVPEAPITGTVVASIAAGAITATAIANGAIDAATFAADVDAEILSYIVDDATRIDASALNTATVTTIPAILVDTGTTLDGKIDTIDTNVDSILADTGTDGVVVASIAANAVSATAIANDAITAAKIANGAIDAATFAANAITSTVVADGFITAAKIADGALDAATFTAVIGTGTCDASSTTTSVIASAVSPASAVNDQFNGRIMIFDRATTTAALRGQATDITDYVHATLTFTVTALTTAPASGDTFHIL